MDKPMTKKIVKEEMKKLGFSDEIIESGIQKYIRWMKKLTAGLIGTKNAHLKAFGFFAKNRLTNLAEKELLIGGFSMKYLIFSLCLILSACGSATSGSGAMGGGTTTTASLHTYTLVMSGDNVSFTGHIFTDTMQASPGIITIAPGQTATITATGNNAYDTVVQRTNTSGVAFQAILYKDGAQVEASPNLFINGEYQTFGAF